MQMGEIPLLTAREELAAAKRIENGRRRFPPVHVGQRLCAPGGREPAGMHPRQQSAAGSDDRSLGRSTSARRRGCLRCWGRICTRCIICCGRTGEILPWRCIAAIAKKCAAKHGGGCCNRRVKAVRLVEELGLRTQRLQPMLEKLQQISQRMDGIKEQLADHAATPDAPPEPWNFARNCATSCGLRWKARPRSAAGSTA